MKRAVLCLSWALLTSLGVIVAQHLALDTWRTRDKETQQIIRAYSKAHDELKERADTADRDVKTLKWRLESWQDAYHRLRHHDEVVWKKGPNA